MLIFKFYLLINTIIDSRIIHQHVKYLSFENMRNHKIMLNVISLFNTFQYT